MSLDYQALLSELGLEDSEGEANNTFQKPSQPKIVINVSLPNNSTKQLMIYDEQQVEDAVFQFCRQNNLDEQAYGQILKQIEGYFKTPTKLDDTDVTLQTAAPYTPTEFIDDDFYGEHRPKDVYDRLYLKAMIKRDQLQEIEDTSRDRNHYQLQQYWARNTLPPGERLYNFCQKRQMEKEYQVKKMKDMEQQELEGTHTFTPQINRNNVWNGYQNVQVSQEEHVKRLTTKKQQFPKDDKLRDHEQQCTFHPKISEISNQLAGFMKQARQFDNVYDTLYYQAKEKHKKQSPKQNIPSVEFTSTKKVVQGSSSPFSFLDRVRMDIEKKQHKLDFLRKQNNNVDMRTGKALFAPQIGRAPKGSQPSEQIFDQLYNQATSITQKINELKDEEKRDLERLMVKCNERSEDIAFEQRKQGLRNVFGSLDQDDLDGYHNPTQNKSRPLQRI